MWHVLNIANNKLDIYRHGYILPDVFSLFGVGIKSRKDKGVSFI